MVLSRNLGQYSYLSGQGLLYQAYAAGNVLYFSGSGTAFAPAAPALSRQAQLVSLWAETAETAVPLR